MGQKNRLNLHQISSRLVGQKFAAGWKAYEAGEGLDCFTLVIEYLRLRGYEITGNQEYLGVKAKNYLRVYEESQVKGIGLVIGFFKSFLEKVKINYSLPGDILILKNKKIKTDVIHFGVESGNDQVIVALNGLRVELLEKKYFEVIGAFTWAEK